MLTAFHRGSLAAIAAAALLQTGPVAAPANAGTNFNKQQEAPRAITNFNRSSNTQTQPVQQQPEPSTTRSLFNFNNTVSVPSTTERAATTGNSLDSTGDALDALSERTTIYSANRSVAPVVNINSESTLKSAIRLYEQIASNGGWGTIQASKSLRKGGKGKGVVAVRRRLAIEGYLPRSAANGDVFDGQVQQAVAGFQENHGLRVTGTIDAATAKALSVPVSSRLETMRANLIRLPEYSKGLSGRYVVVNIPAARLEAVSNNRVVSSHAVIVGKPERPSPIVSSEISEINFNPYWHSPKSIVEKDIVPKVRKSRAILDQLQIKIFDGYDGPEVDPASIDWNSDAAAIAERYHFRQEPGGENAMASTKINFHNKYAVYMHDTPTKSLFNEGQRYFSSGCVRVEDVQQLTAWILANQDGWNLPQIKSVARSEERIDVKLNDKVLVRWVYLTAWAGPDGMVNFRDDIYSLDGTGFITGQPIGSPEESAG